ncbi:restriction endonuclease subunit S [Cetobacterium sp.]
MSKLEQLIKELCPDGVEYKTLGEVFNILAGGDVPKKFLSDVKTEEFNIPILSNGIDEKSLYGWTNVGKVVKPSLTISARGTIGWTSFREEPFFPIVRLLVLTPKIELNLKFAYYFMKMIENDYKVPTTGIPQLTKPMINNIEIPLPPLPIQEEIVRILDTFTELTAELTMRKQQYEYYRETLFNFENSSIKFVPMGDETIGKFTRGSGLQKKDFTNNGVGCIHYGQIYTYYGTYTIKTKTFVSEEFAKKSRIARHGDLIIATTSENDEDVCKAVAWLGNEGIAISGDACFYTHKLNPKYVAYFFQTEQFQKQKRLFITGTKVRRVNVSALEKILIPLPPLEEQERIVDILDRFDTLVNDIKTGLPAEIEARQKQYEYYRDKLLTFKKLEREV